MSDVVQIISTVGFPIFSFLLCGAGLKYVYAVEKNSEAIRDLAKEIHKEEV